MSNFKNFLDIVFIFGHLDDAKIASHIIRIANRYAYIMRAGTVNVTFAKQAKHIKHA